MFSAEGQKYVKAKLWNIPTVSVDWLNDVLFGKMNPVECLSDPKYQTFKQDDLLRVDSGFAPNLMPAWKTPIRVTQVRNIIQNSKIFRFQKINCD